MSDEDHTDPNLILAGAKTALGLYEILKERDMIDKVVDLIARRKTTRVLIVGASGTGKSSLLNQLRGIQPAIDREDRTDRVRKVAGKITGKTGDRKRKVKLFEFIDTPGEKLHKAKRESEIRSAAAYKNLHILSVVSYGYHEGQASSTDTVNGASVNPSYLTKRRDLEIAHIKEWAKPLCGPGGSVKSVTTVITKADLWWTPTDGEDVIAHYRDGEYSRQLGHAPLMPHSILKYSSVNRPFYDQVPMSGFYSDDQQKADLRALVRRLLEMPGNE